MTEPLAPRVPILLYGLLIAWVPTCLAVDAPDPTYVDPNNAGPDFTIQGEYLGVVDADGGRNWGVQIIAQGKDSFQLIGYPGGLPGDGYRNGDPTKLATGKRQSGSIKFEGDDFSAEILGGQVKVTNKNGDKLATLMRIRRESPTLGQKPPEGATVLFDGSSADNFTGGSITADKLLRADCSSKATLGDHFLHIEFRTPFKPEARGQARGNSGVYVQSRYEMQVLDSFGLSGEDNECGGIYNIAKPTINMCFPPLSWQTYDIEFKAARFESSGKKSANARITVRHNGVLIHDNLELSKATPGREKEADSPAPLYLQGHGNPVVYRNIWVISR